jgi:hypothetical protein
MMRAEIAITVGTETVVVHELTVAEVRSWFIALDGNTERDALDALVFEDCGLDDLARMTDHAADELASFTPSQLEPVLQAARELNPFFFRVRAALAAATSQLLAAASSARDLTGAPSA